MQYAGLTIEKSTHASFKVSGDGIILYIDPWKLGESPEKADIILITHAHFDHTSPEDVEKLLKEETVVVGNSQVKKALEMVGLKNFKEVAPGEEFEEKGIKIKTIPSYNTNKFKEGNTVFHPKGEGNVGYIAELGGVKIFHPGDADNIEEFKNLTALGIDIAFLPVSGTYVMSWEEAVEACKTISPKVAIPMHWGEIVGGRDDAEKFAKEAGCKVEIM